jgi:hypothetical protein
LSIAIGPDLVLVEKSISSKGRAAGWAKAREGGVLEDTVSIDVM